MTVVERPTDTTTATPPGRAGDRLHGLDAVRGLALLLGVLLHASMSYQPGSQFFWLVSDSDQSVGASLIFHVIHNFRMLTFFLIAGFFGHMQFHRLGRNRFARDRLKRIATPLMIGWPIMITAIFAVVVWSAALEPGASRGKPLPLPDFTPNDFPLTHLWFLYVLVLLYAIVVGARSLVAALDPRGRFRGFVDGAMRTLMGWWAPALLAVPVASSLLSLPEWYRWFGVPTPDRSLYPNAAAWTTFGLAFAVGWLIDRQRPLLARFQQRWAFHLLLALAATGVSLSLVGFEPDLTPARTDAVTVAYAFSYCVSAWSWAFAFLGMGLRFLSAPSHPRRYLADASYWIYLVHLPIVLVLQVLASQLDWPWFIELALSLTAAFAVMLLSYHYLVRYTVIGAILNGRKMPRLPRSPAAATP